MQRKKYNFLRCNKIDAGRENSAFAPQELLALSLAPFGGHAILSL
jgi:hypothetical protein